MRFEPGYLLGMAMQSIPEPRKIARELFALNLDRATLWQILILLMVIGAILGVGSSVLFPPAPELEGTIFAMPLIVAMAEASISESDWVAKITEAFFFLSVFSHSRS